MEPCGAVTHRVRLVIMSDALSVAAFMATMRAACSLASDSTSAR